MAEFTKLQIAGEDIKARDYKNALFAQGMAPLAGFGLGDIDESVITTIENVINSYNRRSCDLINGLSLVIECSMPLGHVGQSVPYIIKLESGNVSMEQLRQSLYIKAEDVSAFAYQGLSVLVDENKKIITINLPCIKETNQNLILGFGDYPSLSFKTRVMVKDGSSDSQYGAVVLDTTLEGKTAKEIVGLSLVESMGGVIINMKGDGEVMDYPSMTSNGFYGKYNANVKKMCIPTPIFADLHTIEVLFTYLGKTKTVTINPTDYL